MRMNLYELNRPNGFAEAAKILQTAGYKQLGSGSFAEVYGKPGDPWVLKLFASNDKSYIHFVQFCLQPANRGNPYLPRFKSGLVKVTDSYYAIRLERLKPCYDVELVNLIDGCMNYALTKSFRYQQQYINMKKYDPKLAETIMKIGAWHENTDAANDIHQNNVLMREDGTPVLIEVTAFMT